MVPLADEAEPDREFGHSSFAVDLLRPLLFARSQHLTSPAKGEALSAAALQNPSTEWVDASWYASYFLLHERGDGGLCPWCRRAVLVSVPSQASVVFRQHFDTCPEVGRTSPS